MSRFSPNPNNQPHERRQPYPGYSGYNAPQAPKMPDYSAPAQSKQFYAPQTNYNAGYTQSQQQQQSYSSNIASNECCLGLNILDVLTKALCEFIGSTFLVFVICLGSLLVGTQLAGLILGLTLIGLYHIFAPISGGHFNPAISMAHWIFNVPHFIEVPLYIIAQMVGSIVGYGFYEGVLPVPHQNDEWKSEYAPCTTSYLKDYEGNALAVEALLMFILTLAYCSSWDKRNEHLKDSASIKIGMLAMVLCTVSMTISGGNLNFIRSFGPAVFHPKMYSTANADPLKSLWVYFVGPALGSIFAALFYKFLILRDFTCSNKET